MRTFAAVLGTAALQSRAVSIQRGSEKACRRTYWSEVTHRPAAANSPSSPAPLLPHKGTGIARQDCNHYLKDTLHRHQRVKGTASLLGLLFPWSYTGNNTTKNNAFKPRGQSHVGIHRSTSPILYIYTAIYEAH